MKKKVLITGGAGFIGSNMASYQLAKGNQVWVVDSLVTGVMKNIEPLLPDMRFDEADLTSWPKLQEAVAWSDLIFHFAANVGQKLILNNPIYTFSNNISACEELLKAMAKAKAHAPVLIISTSELYCHSKENPNGTVSEDAVMSFLPNNFLQDTYPVGKLVNEVMALAYRYETKMHCSIARIFNTVGVNQTSAYGMVVPTFVEQALRGEPLTIYGDGLQTRSFSDVRDTVRALDMLLQTPASDGEVVNVGNDKECRIIDLAKLVLKKTKSKSEIIYLSYEEAYGVPFVDVKRRQPDLTKLKTMTGFEHEWTLEDTIESIIRTYRQ